MSKNFLLTLSGTTPGPFDIYLDSVSAGNLLLSNVDSGSLLGGYIITTPDSSSFVILKNKANGCDNTFTVSIVDPSPTPTPTTTPTTTPSITPTVTPSITISPTTTPSVTITPTLTPSITISPTTTPSITITPTKTPTRTTTPTPTPSSQLVPTSLKVFDASQGYEDGICNGDTYYTNLFRSTQIRLVDQNGDPINAPSTITITAVYNYIYAGGGTNSNNITFTIPAGSSVSNVYNYTSVETFSDCQSQTISFNRILTSSPYYPPIY
jgi:hypothetical protein